MRDLLVQLSDLHVQVGAGDAIATRRVERAVNAVCDLELPAAAVLLSGDLTNVGTPDEYDRLAELLQPLFELGVPLLPLVGNHDDRALLRATFAGRTGGVDLGEERHLQYGFDIGAWRVLVLDTQHTGHDDGKYCDTRQAWLETQLAAAPNTPTLLAMHHPPVGVGLPAFDQIAVRSDHAARFTDLVGRSLHVKLVLCGHVHLPITVSCAHAPVFVCPSVFLPARPDLHEALPITLVEGSSAIGMHVLDPVGGYVASQVWVLDAPEPVTG